ncbi:contact-dependent growth inhibition system immunity protein [Erwinia tracheiphila]|uniref:contact-dependent growth inhibition system immunity protein n=2 Tax=Erwinia tracheiphila TaxID=65700 RepID=UPI0026CBAD6D
MIYSYLDHLMGAYFNQDYDLSGETINEVVQCYIDSEGPDKSSGLASDCMNFLKEVDVEGKFGCDAHLLIMMKSKIPTDDLIVHFL